MNQQIEVDRLLQQVSTMRSRFATGRYDDCTDGIEKVVERLRRFAEEDPALVPESLAINVALMAKVRRLHQHLFLEGRERRATDVIVTDDLRRELVLLRRGSRKRLFPGRLTVPATIKGAVGQADIIRELCSAFGTADGSNPFIESKIEWVDRRFTGRLVSRQIVAFDEVESRRLRRAVNSTGEAGLRRYGVFVTYHMVKRTADIWTIDDAVSEQEVVDAAGIVGDRAQLPVLYPVNERRSTTLVIVRLQPDLPPPLLSAVEKTGDTPVRIPYETAMALRPEDVAADTLGLYVNFLRDRLPRVWTGTAVCTLTDPTLSDRSLGGKGVNTKRLLRAAAMAAGRTCQFSVPSTLVVPAKRYSQHGEVPNALRRELLAAFRHFGHLPVIFRSSATVEDGTASFSGLAESVVVHSEREIIPATKCVWASIRSDGFRGRARTHGDLPTDLGIAVLIQPYINAVAGGVLFTSDLGRPVYRVVAASAEDGGVGAVVEDRTGEEPRFDRYIVNPLARDSRDILESYASPCGSAGSAERALSHTDLLRLVRVVRFIHQRTFIDVEDLDVEWLIDAEGDIHIVQARPLVSAHDKHGGECAEVIDPAEPGIELGGVTAQRGVVVGELWVGESPPSAAAVAGKILFTPSTNNSWNAVFSHITGLVTLRGVEVSHASNNARENHIPAVVGAMRRLDEIRALNGHVVTLDATSQRLFIGDKRKLVSQVRLDLWTSDVESKVTQFRVEGERCFSELHRQWPIVFERSAFDGQIRRKSGEYAYLQRDLYFHGWRRLTAWLNGFFGERGDRPARTQKVVWADNVLYQRFDRAARRDGVFSYLTDLDLSLDEMVSLIDARQEVLDSAAGHFDTLSLQRPGAFAESLDQLTDFLAMSHLGNALSGVFDRQFSFPQVSTVDESMVETLQEAAIDSGDSRIRNLSRERDVLVRVIAAKAATSRNNGSVSLDDPSLRPLVEKLDRYKLSNEDLRVVSEYESNKRLVERFLGQGVQPPVNEAVYLASQVFATVSEPLDRLIADAGENLTTLIQECVRLYGGDPDHDDLYREQFARVVAIVAKQRARNRHTSLTVLRRYPDLQRVLVQDKKLRTAREDQHHTIVDIQRKLVRALSDEVARKGVFNGRDVSVFDYGAAELIEIVEHGRAPEDVDTTWRDLVDRAESDLKRAGDQLDVLKHARSLLQEAFVLVDNERRRAWTPRLADDLAIMCEHIDERKGVVARRICPSNGPFAAHAGYHGAGHSY